jgi:hypothetical protein
VIREIWQKKCELCDMGFESLVGRFILMGENWTKQDIIDKTFMLYQSNELYLKIYE